LVAGYLVKTTVRPIGDDLGQMLTQFHSPDPEPEADALRINWNIRRMCLNLDIFLGVLIAARRDRNHLKKPDSDM
jgi:hypothetical protein